MADVVTIEIRLPMELVQCEHVRKTHAVIERDTRFGGKQAVRVVDVNNAIAAVEAAWARDCAIHANNALAIESNRAMRVRLTEIMKAAGIADGYSVRDEKSRSRFLRTKRLEAGYIADLARTFPVNDGFGLAEQTYRGRLESYGRQRKLAEEFDRQQERDAAAVVERRRADMQLAMLLIRYGLDVGAGWWEVGETLSGRNKYLDLALAMEDCRADWSEGCDGVAAALDRFTIEDDRDKEIATDAARGVASFADGDGDGRVFRDMRWSYDTLYPLVADQQLVTDARLVRAHRRRD